jgi:hypothetical protein
LDLEVSSPTIQAKRKKVSAVTFRVENTRGLKVGQDPSNLSEMKERTNQFYGQATDLTTGDERILIPPLWDSHADIWIRQEYPLPATVLAIIPEVYLGNN